MRGEQRVRWFIGLFALAAMPCFARDFQPWVERFACGKASYTVTSSCKPSGQPDTLNECRLQSMEVVHGNVGRKAELPELTKSTAAAIKGVGGEVKNLFLVNQGCADVGGRKVEIFYYSIGGGSAPYAEAYAVYDESGELLEKRDPRMHKAMSYPFEKLKPVRSIMPE